MSTPEHFVVLKDALPNYIWTAHVIWNSVGKTTFYYHSAFLCTVYSMPIFWVTTLRDAENNQSHILEIILVRIL